MSDKIQPDGETPSAPAKEPGELSDQELDKVSGGVTALDSTQIKQVKQNPAGGNVAALKGWGDPHV